ncbi:MAG TPA: DUF1800 domain-containing protein, partial [Bryobacteraceae bacterium]|nr:DUF1800 domain-containing protein [Bryobacteraceae bacterium]
MKRLLTITGAVAVAALAATVQNPYQTRLSADQRIVHVLNRLTFGPSPGDVEQVRSVGVEKWIDLQLHPDRIPESPILLARLKPLETLRLDPAQILKDYSPANMGPRFTPLTELLPADQLTRVRNGTAEQRQKALMALDPEKRTKVLALLQPDSLDGLPDLQKEAEAARKAQAEERQKEFRKRMPPLNDLLSPDQMNMVYRASPEQLTELFAYFEPSKRLQVAGALPPQSMAAFPEMRREAMKLRQPQQAVIGDLKEGKIFRALYSNRQLEEVLVNFWFNHFNVYEGKNNVNLRPLLASYERDAIRPHVFGHFRDLLLATARHPAMLYYLDNWESISKDAFEVGPFAPPMEQVARQLARQAHGLNENYGREIMELHTLGVNGGYSQDDVVAVARCFTGWTIRQPATKPEFVFAAFMHDTGEKTVLGHRIPAGGGEQDGIQVIDILARHPSTAKFISKELAQKFISDEPPQALIDRMAATFTKTDGDLRAVMETMFASPEFFSAGAFQAKIKTPFEMVVSAIRALRAETTDAFALAQKVSDLGEPLYGKVEPTGYPLTGDVWLSTSNLFGRINFGAALASGQISGVKLDNAALPSADPAAIARRLLGADPSAE